MGNILGESQPRWIQEQHAAAERLLAGVRAGGEHLVDRVDDAVGALHVARPVLRLRGARRLVADHGAVKEGLRKRRSYLREPPWRVLRSPEMASEVILPSTTWYLRMSSVTVPWKSSNAWSAGARERLVEARRLHGLDELAEVVPM